MYTTILIWKEILFISLPILEQRINTSSPFNITVI